MENLKYFALYEEFETANKLIKLGFGELQNLNKSDSFYFLPFQLLSQGFERFMKAYICVGFFEQKNQLPDFKYLRDLGHDLDKLLVEIIDKYYTDYKRKQFIIDKEFLTQDKDFAYLLHIISEFGKHARYYNFDVITSSNKPSINTVDLWQTYENDLIGKLGISYDKVLNDDSVVRGEVFYELSRHIIIVFEKFVSSISRQIIYGNIGQIGKQLTVSNVFDFGLLYEKDYGNTDYRKFTTKYMETPKKVHKRTIYDELERKLNPNFKHKKIKKEEFVGDWPFYDDEVIVECRYNHWCIITINGSDYALNGSAKGRYKLENPHDAGMAIMGKSFSEFIRIARDL